jgi:hypothetical protein
MEKQTEQQICLDVLLLLSMGAEGHEGSSGPHVLTVGCTFLLEVLKVTQSAPYYPRHVIMGTDSALPPLICPGEEESELFQRDNQLLNKTAML